MFENYLSQRIKGTPSSFIREILKVTQKPEIISFAGGLPCRFAEKNPGK